MDVFGPSAESSRRFRGFDGALRHGCKAFWEGCTWDCQHINVQPIIYDCTSEHARIVMEDSYSQMTSHSVLM
ncbi:hypothetical protein NQZ68_007689 [Dissostichus eleginoides]|nr:hypothetical protein NQZ68_007689 [Dissostichus eleginoides]